MSRRVSRSIGETDPVNRSSPATPNAGVAEAAFAAALDVRLGGLNHYDGAAEVRAPVGDGRPVDAADITAAVTLSRHVTWALAGILAAAGLATRPWAQRRRRR